MRFIYVKKIFSFLASLILVLGLVACISYQKKPIPSVNKNYSMPFENVSVQGQVEVKVTQGKHWSLNVYGPADIVQNPAVIKRDVHGFSIKVPENLARKYMRPIVVSVTAPVLRNLVLQDGVIFSGRDLQVSKLKIESSGTNDVTLQGTLYAGSTEINQQGSGKIALAWLQSENVKITVSKSGLVLLAGVGKDLKVDLSGSAYLDSKYFRVSNLNIKARNKAHAEVFAKRRLIATVNDQANIYYYKRPNFMQIYPENSGNVLLLKPEN